MLGLVKVTAAISTQKGATIALGVPAGVTGVLAVLLSATALQTRISSRGR